VSVLAAASKGTELEDCVCAGVSLSKLGSKEEQDMKVVFRIENYQNALLCTMYNKLPIMQMFLNQFLNVLFIFI